MDLYLQFGHGMMGYCKELVSKWAGGTVILSPRDLTEEQTIKFSKDLSKLKGSVLFDPQYYNPRADHHKLTKWSHWLNDYDTSLLSDDKYLESHFLEIKRINDACNTSAYIIPAQMCEEVDRFWLGSQTLFIEKANEIFQDKAKYLTLALSSDVLKDEKSIEEIIDESETWDVDGYYVVPEGDYLESDSNWFVNLALLAAGLKLQERKVIVGYSNHQMLALACADIDAIASGSFLNVRSFSRGKFDRPDPDATSRRAVWYYCPQSLSEYRMRVLDRAYDYDILESMKPFGKINEYVKVLFGGTKPSSVKFGDSLAFKHYLSTLKQQCSLAKRDTFENTIEYHQQLSDNAYEFIRQLKKNGVREADRNFQDIVDVYQVALSKLNKERGALLKRQW